MMNNNNQGKRPFTPGQGGSTPQVQRPVGATAREKITAPYNFVPLSRKVFFPDWAKQVSHDIPFADGISGELVCELVTHTPVYVRNGGKWSSQLLMAEQKDNPAQSFFRVDSEIMIPGTSIKGMLRNVIEIASFGKMNKVDNHRYSVRDLKNRDLYLNKMKEVQAGWLKRASAGNGWILIPCNFALINHDKLQNESIKKAQKSLSKYKSWGWNNLDVRITYKTGQLSNQVTSIGNGEPGKLVFTGQPTTNRGGKTFDKKNEFVFFGRKDNSPLTVPDEIRKDVGFLYTNPNTLKAYEEWQHWQEVLKEGGEVPVFYQMDDSQLGSIGFTRMYRLPYKYRVRQVIEHTSKDHSHEDLDFAETLFGYVSEEQREAGKGRVSISPARADLATVKPFENVVQAVLGSPKPTFYPNYISQPDLNRAYKTYMDPNSTISGWKRYPSRELKDVVTHHEPGTDSVASKFLPLQPGAKFVFKVKLHNLKPEELGALIWGFTWGGNERLRHGIGMGKSLGYGVVGIRLLSASLNNNKDQVVECQQLMQKFVQMMDSVVGGDWVKSAQMEQLLAMADPQQMPQCGRLEHMSLASKDFTNVKGSQKPPVPRLALLPHVKPTAQLDEVRFKNLALRSESAVQAHSSESQAPDGKQAVPVTPVPAGPVDLSGLSALFGKKR